MHARHINRIAPCLPHEAIPIDLNRWLESVGLLRSRVGQFEQALASASARTLRVLWTIILVDYAGAEAAYSLMTRQQRVQVVQPLDELRRRVESLCTALGTAIS